MARVKFTNAIYPLLAVLLAGFAVAPLEYPGAFQSHTGLLAYYNLIDLDQHPNLGWAPILGQTFDVFRTEGVLPYLLAEIFHRIGASYLDSIKLVYALAWMMSGLAMYAFAQKLFSHAGALLAATVYVYLPFHIATIYVRGAFAESFAWALFPLILLTLLRHQTAYGLLLTALLFLTQPGIAILFSLFTICIAIAFRPSSSVVRPVLTGLVLGTLFYLPTLLRYGANIARDRFNPAFVHPFQLFSALWDYGISTDSYLDRFPFQLGAVPVGLVIIALVLATQSNAPTNIRRIVLVFLGAVIVLALFTFEITAPLWTLIGVFVTYPWQLLAIVGLALAIVAGSVIELDQRFTQPAMLAFFVALPVVASYGYLAPRFLDVNPMRPPIAIFNHNEIALWDYRIVGPLRHGATLRVYLTWQALRPVDYDYTIFLHAINEDGNTYGENDAKPLDGALPTLKWTPGQVITDTQTIQIDVEGPREGYRLEFGMYNAATGRRAFTETGADHLILPRPGDPAPIISEQLPPNKTP